MADVVFGGIFLILVWCYYRIISSALTKTTHRAKIMRACLYAIACSIALTLYALFGVTYGSADASPFAAYWLYVLLASGLLGGIGIVCATVVWAVRKFSRQTKKDAHENDMR